MSEREPFFRQSVWSYVQGAVEDAEEEYEDFLAELPQDTRAVLKLAAGVLLKSHRQLAAPRMKQLDVQAIWDMKDEPIFVQALDLAFAVDAIARIGKWRKRFVSLAPVHVGRMADDRVRAYMGEATQAFLYGFDDACIALCRATLEQMLKELWVRAGLSTWDEVQKSHVELSARIAKASAITLPSTGEDAGASARGRRLSARAVAAANRIAREANDVLHRRLTDSKIRQRIASDCLGALSVVVGELYGLPKVGGV